MHDILLLQLQAKKYQLLGQLIELKQQIVDNAIRYKEKSTSDIFYAGAYNVTQEFIRQLDELSAQFESLFTHGAENYE